MPPMMPPMPAVADKVLHSKESFTTIARTVQWRLNTGVNSIELARRTKEFKLANCTWCLGLNCATGTSYKSLDNKYTLHLSVLDCSNLSVDAQFVLRIAHGNMSWQSCIINVGKHCFRNGDCSYEHALDKFMCKQLVIDLEFLDLKISKIDENESPLVQIERPRVTVTQGPLHFFTRMFTESIHADVTINTKNGTLMAHKAVLASSSSVFASMFENDFREKISSTIDLPDMSLESCKAFLSYLYGDLKEDDLCAHRCALLEAGHKYGIVSLQSVCEESLIDDINLCNVLERLSQAYFYELKNLKKGCFSYLFDLGRVYYLVDEFSDFILTADQGLAKEIFWMMLAK